MHSRAPARVPPRLLRFVMPAVLGLLMASYGPAQQAPDPAGEEPPMVSPEGHAEAAPSPVLRSEVAPLLRRVADEGGYGVEQPTAEEESGEEEGLTTTYGSEVTFNSRYVWRGLAWSEGPVMQPSTWASKGGRTFWLWSNFVLTREPQRGRFNEVDLGFSYARERGKTTIEPRIEFWTYPNQDPVESPPTGEVSFKASRALGSVQLFTTHSFDYLSYVGSYFGEAGLSYGHQFDPETSLEAIATLGWASSKFNEVYVGPAKSALDMVGLDLTLTYYPSEHLYLCPHVGFTALLDRDLRAQVKDPDLLVFGLMAGWEF